MKKSYFYVFVEDPWDRDKLVTDVFTRFQGVHKADADVTVLRPDAPGFEDARTALGIRKLPGFAIADAPLTFSATPADPFVSFERGVLEMYENPEQLYRLISDIHYILKDENILRVNRKLTETRLGAFFKKFWEEVKDVVTISVP